MSTIAGTKIWDKNGKLVVGPSTSLGSILGVVQTEGVNGSITDSRFANGKPCVFAALPVEGMSQISNGLPKFSFSGNTMSWAYEPSAFYKNNVRVLYGIH